MHRIRRLLCMMLLLLIPAIALPALAQERDSSKVIIQDMISYYFHYRDRASAEIENQLEILSGMDRSQGQAWEEIMTTWAWTNEEMDVHMEVLPDGLPEDDSLCIVILGYGLNADGSMQKELTDRLEVALRSAQKYPQAYLLCTGGETSHTPGISEAGQMAAWLRQQGIGDDRIIAENALNSSAILHRDYPKVRSIAIVSSDYHIRWGSVLFSTVSILEGNGLEVVSNAACATEKSGTDTMYSQAWGISVIAGVPFDSTRVPTLYMTEDTVPPETEAAVLPASEPVIAEQFMEEPVVPVLLVLGALLAVIFIPKKKSGSD